MIDNTIKKISSIIEILILYIIFLYLSIKTFKKYSYLSYKYKFANKESLDPTIVSVLHSNKKPKNLIINYTTILVKKIFSNISKVFHQIFEIFHKIFGSFTTSINQIRNLTKPIRTFFKNTTQMFYNKLNNYMISISYLVHKIRDTLKKSVSGYNLVFHSLNHIYYSLQSILNSPIPNITKKFIGATKWLDKSFSKLGLCFDPDTIINTIYGDVKISDLELETELDKDNFIISIHKFICECDIYNFNNILVSGSHLVNYDNKWIRIENIDRAKKIIYKKPFIYCINTTKGYIKIKDYYFKDFSESTDKSNNKLINNIVLSKLNNSSKIINNNSPHYIEQGLGKNTLIKMTNGLKCISKIKIGDILYNNNHVLGIIVISSKYNKIYNYKEKYIFSNNVKVNELGIWLCVEDSIYSKEIKTYKDKLYHLVTSKEIINLETINITDYIEIHNTQINNKIDQILEKKSSLKCN